MNTNGSPPGLLGRLEEGPVICAEGYLFELERRGHLQAGAFVPEVVIENPEEVAQLHRQFVHAGSDVVQAFTYYAHREKLRLVGKEDLLERINRKALVLAREVAEESGVLFAGDICNTNVYHPDAAGARREARTMIEEQVGWAVEAGVDFIVGETFSYAGEALIGLDLIKEAGLPAVITLSVHREPQTREGWSVAEACKRLEDAGADVVGLNCIRGPKTMMPLLEEIVPVVDAPVAALPVPYRTHQQEPTFQSLRDPCYEDLPTGIPFPTALDPFYCNRYEISDFTRDARNLGVGYFGLCCGAAPHHLRSMAEALGRTPPASRYSADMSRHAFFGTDPTLRGQNIEYRGRL